MTSPYTTFPPRGLTYFWFLNRDDDMTVLRAQLDAFAAAGTRSLVLHPREGNLVPYGGDHWFDFIAELVDACVERGIQPWLYDEDPYPSGSAAGWIVSEKPEFAMRGIERHAAPDDLAAGELFLFPAGKLLWCGLVADDLDPARAVDLTSRVGMIRRHWEASPWDSRWYYPATPRYACPRSSVSLPEFALKAPEAPQGFRLVAFVARPVGHDSVWGHFADSLNPAATDQFIQRVHERYAARLGDRLGRLVPAIFTDEPKFHASRPYTPGMLEDFQQQYGYDLGPRLECLFEPRLTSIVTLTRIHFYAWCGKRFEDVWLRPVARWCAQHDVALVGHISPEDDPSQQALSLGNLMPLLKHLSLAGLDLIIPAVGDADHPMINVGPACAVSVAQQRNKPGVMSETLACAGEAFTGAEAGRILAWQVTLGVGSIVPHGAFASKLGLRRHDAGPDYGPDGPRFAAMAQIDHGLRPFIDAVSEATHDAPVAIIWPIRSFLAESVGWQHEPGGRRGVLTDLLLACHQHQVGTHFIDEADLLEAEIHDDGSLTLGRARYRHVILPAMLVIHEATVRRLDEARAAGVEVTAVAEAPSLMQNDAGLASPDPQPWTLEPAADLPGITAWVRRLPACCPIDSPRREHLRATRWRRDGEDRVLLMNIAWDPAQVEIGGASLSLEPAELVELRMADDRVEQVGSGFATQSVPQDQPAPETLPVGDFDVRFDDEAWQPLGPYPKAAYQLRPLMREIDQPVHLMLTGLSAKGGLPVAERMTYRTTIEAPAEACSQAVLRLEPTAARGRITVELGDAAWTATLSDTSLQAVEIPVGEHLRPGVNTITLRVDGPELFDGLKWPPTVLRHGA